MFLLTLLLHVQFKVLHVAERASAQMEAPSQSQDGGTP